MRLEQECFCNNNVGNGKLWLGWHVNRMKLAAVSPVRVVKGDCRNLESGVQAIGSELVTNVP